MTERNNEAAPGDEPGALPRSGRRESDPSATGGEGTREHPQVVGIPEIAARLGVKRETVDMWRWRGLLPAPRWVVGGRPAWRWSDVERWSASR